MFLCSVPFGTIKFLFVDWENNTKWLCSGNQISEMMKKRVFMRNMLGIEKRFQTSENQLVSHEFTNIFLLPNPNSLA